MDTRWKIHKFGGSSLADADCFRRVAGLMLERDGARLGVVVSAMGGMTDALFKPGNAGPSEMMTALFVDLNAIGERYSETARALLDGDALVAVLDEWGQMPMTSGMS